MKKLLTVLLLCITCISCRSGNESDKAAFVTKLGNDTLAVEQFEKTEDSIFAKVILRSPSTSFSAYELSLDSLGGIESMSQTVYPTEAGFNASGTIVHSVKRTGDSLHIEYNTENGTRNFSVPYEAGVLPFIDMVHWPFELAFNQAAASSEDSIHQRLLSGRRTSTFIIAKIDKDSMTIRHPSRGVMGVLVDENGNIEKLDAGLTTRKLKVHRVPEIDIDAIGESFASRDESGNPFGQLSGAETAEFSFKNANFQVDYGSPLKRGRALFGGIVSWGERWRTGANRATHFYTSRDLKFGDLEVPAGEYTLFTIPEPDGGTLIINKQTGQNGRSYDKERDLGRVPMQISKQDEVTEAFTITVEETDDGGVLKLIWGDTVFSADFMVE